MPKSEEFKFFLLSDPLCNPMKGLLQNIHVYDKIISIRGR
jgi:hypothetical protein